MSRRNVPRPSGCAILPRATALPMRTPAARSLRAPWLRRLDSAAAALAASLHAMSAPRTLAEHLVRPRVDRRTRRRAQLARVEHLRRPRLGIGRVCLVFDRVLLLPR